MPRHTVEVDRSLDDAVAKVRQALGGAIFERIAGADGVEQRSRLRRPDGERWFDPGSPITRVHGDASMFIGGLSALLLQSLHPLAMAGVDQHSGYRGDPWGRLARTSKFLAVTTFGTAADARRQLAAVRKVHQRVVGTAPDGRAYAASDPHLLRWVHVAEADSFLVAHQRYGAQPLDAEGRDTYVAQIAQVAEARGVAAPPRTEAELREQLRGYRTELATTPAARDTARFLLLNPPLPLLARAPYGGLAASAVATLPLWARRMLWLPYFPVTERLLVRTTGTALTSAIRWAMVGDR